VSTSSWWEDKYLVPDGTGETKRHPSITRLPSDDGQSEGGSLPSTHSVFGTSEEVEVEVEVEVEDEAEEEFEEVEVESELEEVAECD
jgi:hypothetical protein